MAIQYPPMMDGVGPLNPWAKAFTYIFYTITNNIVLNAN